MASTQPDLGNSVDTLGKAVDRLTARLDSGIPVAAAPSPEALEAARRFRDVRRGLQLRLPLELVAQPKSATEIALAWTADEPEITPTKLLRCQGVRCENFNPLADVGAKQTSYLDSSSPPRPRIATRSPPRLPRAGNSSSIAEATTTKS
jgi:hypothetical protein